MKIVDVQNLQKRYTVYERKGLKRNKKIIDAVSNITFSANEGDFIGYIGPNGAGKSTTIKILTGIMTPDGGSVVVNGMVPHENRKKYVRNIGVVFGQKTQLWWDLPVRDTYTLLKSIYGVAQSDFSQRMDYLMEQLDLKEIINQPVRQLSLGQRMRAELAAALVHDPDILFLDEPTIGLDVISKHKVISFLKDLNDSGKTIFLTTHDLKDIEAICKDILVINHGTLVYKGSMDGLKEMVRLPKILNMQLRDGCFSLDERKLNLINEYSGHYDETAGRIRIEISNSETPASVVKSFMEMLDIEDFRIMDPSIEDVVKDIYLNKN